MPPKAKPKPDSEDDSQWRSRFPLARIKKIMQADDDVGKVAQVVPVIISKALELFMASIVEEVSRHTIETGHRRAIPGHIKMAVRGNSMFDFLEPNVDKIPDPIHVEAKAKAEDRKPRKPRAKKSEDATSLPDPARHGEFTDEESDSEQHSRKRIKTTFEPPRHHSMSIANLMSSNDI